MLSHVEKNAVEWLLLYSAAACGVNPFSSRCSAGFLVACKYQYIHTYSQQKLKTNAIISKRLKLIFFEGFFCFLLLSRLILGLLYSKFFRKEMFKLLSYLKQTIQFSPIWPFLDFRVLLQGELMGHYMLGKVKSCVKCCPQYFYPNGKKATKKF